MELTLEERRKRFEKFIELGTKVLKKGLFYVPTKELDLGADIDKLRLIISESTPYADRMKKSAKYTSVDIIKVKKLMVRYNSDTFFTAIPFSIPILLRELGKMKDIYTNALDDGESPDRSRNWFHGKSKTFYMISNMIKDGIIRINEIEEKAVHGGIYKTRLITDIKVPIQDLEKLEQEDKEDLEKLDIKQDIIEINRQQEEFKAKHPELQALEKVDQTEQTQPDMSEEEKEKTILEGLKMKVPISDVAKAWNKSEEEIHAIFIQSLRK